MICKNCGCLMVNTNETMYICTNCGVIIDIKEKKPYEKPTLSKQL
jgi:transcription initiation factor TFIIIB Brf1 subunit/transcription initiation factor TFIIB